jgi:hypothetical protein
LPKINLLLPSIVRFVSNEGLTDFSATVEWCGDMYLAIESIENPIISIVILVTWWDSKILVTGWHRKF